MIKDIEESHDLISWLERLGFVKDSKRENKDAEFAYIFDANHLYVAVEFFFDKKKFYLYKHDVEEIFFVGNEVKYFEKNHIIDFLNEIFEKEIRREERKKKIKNLLRSDK